MFDPQLVIKQLVSQPSVSTDSRFAEGMAGAREVLVQLFKGMGLETELLKTDRHPVVMARRDGPADWPHVVIYGHYDVQPPDPLELWESPPFEPTVRGTRLFGRGAADNKGPMMVHLAAAASLLEENPELPLRLTFLIEGEEEIGSTNLPAVLRDNAGRLRGDFILLSDTLNPTATQVAITTGIRGIASFEIEVSGPRGDLHSGMFGGAVLNPLEALMTLCSSLHHPDGRIHVPGFYDHIQPPSEWEEAEVAKLGITDADFCEMTGAPEVRAANGRTAMEAIRYEPTLEFNGIGGGYQGEGEKTIIPARAFAKITCRLVADQDPEDIRRKVFATLRERCPSGVRIDFRIGHEGFPYSVVPPGRPNTAPDLNPHLAKAFEAVDQAVAGTYGTPPLYLREGGSIPIIGHMKRILGMDCLMLGMGTAENNLHAPNESFDLAELPKGIAVSRVILRTVAGV